MAKIGEKCLKEMARSARFRMLAIIFLFLMNCQGANGFSIVGSGRVFFLQSIAISEQESIDFGVISQVAGICSLTASGMRSGSCGAGLGVPGLYRITGTPGMAVSMAVQDSPEVDGVSFSPNIDGPSTRIIGNNGYYDFIVSGNLLVMPAAATGNRSLTYTLTVNYQ